MVETWEWQERTQLDIPEFVRIGTAWNPRKRGRGFGGLAVWKRKKLGRLPAKRRTSGIRRAGKNWYQANSPSPDDLFTVLEQAGVLWTPSATESRIREDFDLPEEASVDKWSVLKTHQIVLVRDLAVTDRIAYKVESTPLEQDDEGISAVAVSKLWSGHCAPAYASFGALLGGEDGLFRAGIEVGEGGWRCTDIIVGTTVSKLRPNLFA
ncbi:hypothetical protein R1sor_027220 [Riccia sorocarpa]|uniref:Uncharacterized protein n=1 Tax=Riccia sorocarpa TaxID=122646 RepID=A0ABD3GGG4_9MARC